ncbi:hypothetical protein NEDG_00954 [Nematocida displodere]|uniref:Uncharacterized protein n=1 Tax=Nematocida displodere TaxID=1805483 RepID=A0A177EA74_9MICR|nr:hypothetical protein NEDG_00954 [Nematocida displodere]
MRQLLGALFLLYQAVLSSIYQSPCPWYPNPGIAAQNTGPMVFGPNPGHQEMVLVENGGIPMGWPAYPTNGPDMPFKNANPPMFVPHPLLFKPVLIYYQPNPVDLLPAQHEVQEAPPAEPQKQTGGRERERRDYCPNIKKDLLFGRVQIQNDLKQKIAGIKRGTPDQTNQPSPPMDKDMRRKKIRQMVNGFLADHHFLFDHLEKSFGRSYEQVQLVNYLRCYSPLDYRKKPVFLRYMATNHTTPVVQTLARTMEHHKHTGRGVISRISAGEGVVPELAQHTVSAVFELDASQKEMINEIEKNLIFGTERPHPENLLLEVYDFFAKLIHYASKHGHQNIWKSNPVFSRVLDLGVFSMLSMFQEVEAVFIKNFRIIKSAILSIPLDETKALGRSLYASTPPGTPGNSEKHSNREEPAFMSLFSRADALEYIQQMFTVFLQYFTDAYLIQIDGLTRILTDENYNKSMKQSNARQNTTLVENACFSHLVGELVTQMKSYLATLPSYPNRTHEGRRSTFRTAIKVVKMKPKTTPNPAHGQHDSMHALAIIAYLSEYETILHYFLHLMFYQQVLIPEQSMPIKIQTGHITAYNICGLLDQEFAKYAQQSNKLNLYWPQGLGALQMLRKVRYHISCLNRAHAAPRSNCHILSRMNFRMKKSHLNYYQSLFFNLTKSLNTPTDSD